MKLEVGMYVRTNEGIGTVQRIYNNKNGCTVRFKKGHVKKWVTIFKASHNIIDLLEVGDVVELFMEDDIDKENTNIFELVAITTDKKEIGVFNSDFEIEFFSIDDIKSIVTKEQFESMSYKVEE